MSRARGSSRGRDSFHSASAGDYTGPGYADAMIGYAERRDRLTPDEVSAVVELARAAGDTDGAYPLSEHTVLHLRHGGEAPAVHLIARTPDGELAGYAHVDV